MRRNSTLSCLCALGCMALVPALARATPSTDDPFDAPPVSDSQLDGMRGGFDLGNGTVASFGISRMVYINGNLVADTSVNIPDLARISSEQANALSNMINKVSVIQNGPGNSVDPASFDQQTGALVIQNTLDNQRIQTLTTLNASVHDLAQFSSINLGSTLQSALTSSLGH